MSLPDLNFRLQLNGMFLNIHPDDAWWFVFSLLTPTSVCQLAAATDRIRALQEEQQELKQENELIRERSEKHVEVRYSM